MSHPVDAIPAEQSEQPQPTTPNNLPLQPTPLIGRKHEAERICQALLSPDVRLFTMTGPPGVGKTRLSLHVASSLLSSFPDGIFFIDLAPISEPSLVLPAIAQVLGIRQVRGESVLATLKAQLRENQALLLLDNFEQVIGAASLIADLLQSTSRVRLLITSRVRLHVRGEHEMQIPPLSLPDLISLPPIERLLEYDAVSLFVQRAVAIKQNFEITDSNAHSVAEICCRLDGLPLAIELAAARIKILPAESMALRLQSTLHLLTGGHQDLPVRHQTLRAAIEWSHGLLNSRERMLFRRLGVFVGGCSLQAVEQMASPEVDALDVIGSLVDKSLVRQDEVGGEPRFTMLETIREYARERLEESGESEEIRQLHALYFASLAEEAELRVWGPKEGRLLDRLEVEHDNMRAAVEWSHGVGGDVEIELRLVVALGRFWEIRGHLAEGRERLASALSRPESHDEKVRPLRAWALTQAEQMAYWQGDLPAARSAIEEALPMFRELGNRLGTARALADLWDVTTAEGDHEKSRLLATESLQICRELGDVQGIVMTQVLLGWSELYLGNFTQARTQLEEALNLARKLGVPNRVALALAPLGEVMMRQGKYEQAMGFLEEGLAIRRDIGHRTYIGTILGSIALTAMRQNDYHRATQMLVESLTVRKEVGDKGGIAWCLEKFAQMESSNGDSVRAARLLGASGALRETMGTSVDMVDQAEYDEALSIVRDRLGEEAFATTWQEGRALSTEQAIACALEYKVTRPLPSSPVNGTALLTHREREIAALIAQSKSNAEIAEALVITKRTVETHIGNILSKLGFTSRGQIAAWAIKNGLVNDL